MRERRGGRDEVRHREGVSRYLVRGREDNFLRWKLPTLVLTTKLG